MPTNIREYGISIDIIPWYFSFGILFGITKKSPTSKMYYLIDDPV